MIIDEINIKGYKSFGNNEQTLKLNKDKGELILLVGDNGNGKCVDGDTTFIDIQIDDLDLNNDLIEYLKNTEVGLSIISYLGENNTKLYNKIIEY
jgi:predicted ATP-binding protein involved in virulence